MSQFGDLDFFTATIAAGQSLSGQVSLGQKTLVGIYMPAAWTAADLTFQVSGDGGTTFEEFVVTDLTAANAVATVQVHTPAASQFIGLDPAKFRGVNCIKVRSGTSGTPVNQVAQAVITLALRGVL
jgi:hypothetical protein